MFSPQVCGGNYRRSRAIDDHGPPQVARPRGSRLAKKTRPTLLNLPGPSPWRSDNSEASFCQTTPTADNRRVTSPEEESTRRFNSAPSKLDTPTELASGMTRVAELNLRLRT